MNKSVEKEYYKYLENVIRHRKQQGLFFPLGTRDYEMDLSLLLEHIQRKNPALMDKILDNYIDLESIPALKNASDNAIGNFMKATPKGTIAHLKNANGESVYIINNGSHQKLQLVNSKLKNVDLEILKKSVFGTILKKDIEHVYDKIHAKESKKKSKKSIFEKSPVGDNKFEENFMNIARQWGTSASPMSLAGAYISTMSGIEKKEVLGMFKTKGLNSADKLCTYLNQLVDKAHTKERVIEREITRNVKPISYTRSRY